MKKTAILLVMISLLSPALSQEVMGGVVDSVIAYPYRDSQSCNVSESYINAIKEVITSELNLSDYPISSVSYSYCHSYDSYSSNSFTLTFRKSESEFLGKQVSVSIYSQDVYDYSLLFNKEENEVLDYTLKQKYAEYLVNGTDEEFYSYIYPKYESGGVDCKSFKNYYDSLSAIEKYYNEDWYCSAVVKVKASGIKSLVNSQVSYISYYGEDIYFQFHGYATGSYDLESLSRSLNCDLSSNDYYYPEFATDCYGIYKDTPRAYLSTWSDKIYINIYGYIGGKAKISVNAYDKGVSNDEMARLLNEFTNTYLGREFSISLDSFYGGLEGSLIINDFRINEDLLSSLNKSEYSTETYYWSEGVSITMSKPYIQVYIPDSNSSPRALTETVSSSEASVDSEIMPRYPVYWNRYFIITGDKVYSEITLDSNDLLTAESKIKDLLNPYIETGNWVLNMSVSRGYYPIMLYETALKSEGAFGEASDSGSIAQSIINQASRQVTTLNDAFTINYPDFKDLDEPEAQLDLWSLIINFFKGLFGI